MGERADRTGLRALALLLLLGALLLAPGCAGAPDPAPAAPAEATLPAPPPPEAVPAGLPLPAWIGLVRLVEGRATPIPAAELALWTGAMRQVSRSLIYPVRARPLILATPGRPPDLAGTGAADPPDLAAHLAAARRAGFDAVLVYALAARAESDGLLAGIADLPLFGGAVGPTVTTEVHGAARAMLVGTATGAELGRTEARMVDRPIGPVALTGGDGAAVQGWADYALLQALLPGAEDMVTGVIAAGF